MWKSDNDVPGGYMIKARLALKAFAERRRNQSEMYSPTASRDAHRYMGLTASLYNWTLWSMDVSTAFLQGWAFGEMKQSGHERKPCAFQPDADMWNLLAELNHDYYGRPISPKDWAFEIAKGAYGLKDAVLL